MTKITLFGNHRTLGKNELTFIYRALRIVYFKIRG